MKPISLCLPRRAGGFSLLEVLVAFVILAMAMGTLMQVFSGGLRNVGLSREYVQAVNLARNQLSAVGVEIPLAPGVATGEYENTYHWTLTMQPMMEEPVPNQNQQQASSASSSFGLMQLQLVVEWMENGNRPRSITLDSARFYPKKP